MDKYGFVYIWRDKGKDRNYIGCHWGDVDDGYICSSNWMKKSKKKRPKDFRRKILKSNIPSKEETIIEEYKWLQLIKTKDLGKRYYNFTKFKYSASGYIKRRIPWNKGRNDLPPSWNKGKEFTEEHRKKLSESHKGMSPSNKGIPKTEEQKKILSDIAKEMKILPPNRKGCIPWNKGREGIMTAWNKGVPTKEETKAKQSKARKNYFERKRLEANVLNTSN